MSHHHQALRHQAHLLREQVLKLHNYQCKCCGRKEGDGERLQLHHIKPLHYGGESTLRNLIPLCQACHTRIHKAFEKKEPIAEGLMKA